MTARPNWFESQFIVLVLNDQLWSWFWLIIIYEVTGSLKFVLIRDDRAQNIDEQKVPEKKKELIVVEFEDLCRD